MWPTINQSEAPKKPPHFMMIRYSRNYFYLISILHITSTYVYTKRITNIQIRSVRRNNDQKKKYALSTVDTYICRVQCKRFHHSPSPRFSLYRGTLIHTQIYTIYTLCISFLIKIHKTHPYIYTYAWSEDNL